MAMLLLLFGLSMQQFVMRHVLTYRFTEDSVQAVLFGSVPVSITSYDRIEEVRQVSWAEAFLYPHAWRAANRLNGPFLVILRKWGLPVAISPEDPEGFARELRRRVFQQTGRLPLGS